MISGSITIHDEPNSSYQYSEYENSTTYYHSYYKKSDLTEEKKKTFKEQLDLEIKNGKEKGLILGAKVKRAAGHSNSPGTITAILTDISKAITDDGSIEPFEITWTNKWNNTYQSVFKYSSDELAVISTEEEYERLRNL